MNVTDELIRLYAKQLKIPSFTEYQEILRQADPSAGFADLLLTLAYNIIPLTIFAVIVIVFASFLKKRRKNRNINGPNQKKTWFRKKDQTVGDIRNGGDFIPPSSEDPVDRK